MLIGDFYYRLPTTLPQLSATSLYFVAFCFGVFCLARPFRSILRPLILLVANFVFVLSFSAKSLYWLLFFSLTSYVLALLMEHWHKVWLFWGGVLFYALTLFIFKFDLTFVGNWLMPLGLSFYSFKIIAYLVDVYKRKLKAERNLLYYLDFIMFFPCITAGPINRADSFLKELRRHEEFDYSDIGVGFFMLACGLFEKVVVCDFIKSVELRTLGNAELTGLNVLLGVFLYSLDIYLDFDAYSNIAIGVARMLGFHFKKNFNVPYLAVSIKDFWNRWHISLSSWLRNYIYFPLGGSRKGEVRKYLNILAVFLVSSLWHGLTLNFLIWGMGHALIRIVEELLGGLFKNKRYLWPAGVVLNFCLVSFLWIFFRYSNFNEAWSVIGRILTGGRFDYEAIGLTVNELKWLMVLVVGTFLLDLLRYFVDIYEVIGRGFFGFRWVLYVLMIMIFLIFGVYGGGAFEAGDFIYRWF